MRTKTFLQSKIPLSVTLQTNGRPEAQVRHDIQDQYTTEQSHATQLNEGGKPQHKRAEYTRTLFRLQVWTSRNGRAQLASQTREK